MRKIIVLLLMLSVGSSVLADQYVRGYYRQNGTYVNGYHRSSPNSTRLDNYSTRGNVNPYTGQRGTRSPYGSSYGNNYNNYNRGYGSRY